MSRRPAPRDVLWLSLLAGAFLLLVVNVVFGLRGFDRPHAGFVWRLLEAPGVVLGWGGVALLLLAIPYALLTWLRGHGPGRLFTVLGALAVALAIGGLAGCLAATPVAGGGRVAGGLAHVLEGAVGRIVAGILFSLICLPGLLLALAPLFLQATTAVREPGSEPPQSPFGGARGWYPERQVGPDGVEIPMALPGTDVGEIRLKEPEPPPPEPEPEGPPAIASLPASSARKSRPISGIRFADEETAATSPAAAPEGLPVPDESRLPQGVRFATREPAIEEPPELAPVEEPAREPEPEPPRPVAEPAPIEPAKPAPPPPAPSKAAKPPRSKPKPTKPSDAPNSAEPKGRSSAEPKGRSLFSSLPPEELPAPAPPIDEAPAPPEPRVDAPGQTSLFEGRPASPATAKPPAPMPPSGVEKPRAPAKKPAPVAPTKPEKVAEATPPLSASARPIATGSTAKGAPDPAYAASVEAALERGSASLVLLQRKLGVGYARAAALMERLVAEGVLGEMTASGSRPTLITAAEWAKRRGR